jgi:hypothetical protein
MCLSQFFHTDTGHRGKVGTTWHLQQSRNSALRGDSNFDDLSVRSRYGPPGCSLPGLIQTRQTLPAWNFYFRASSHWVTPMTAGYNYGAKLRIAPVGLTPTTTAAILAASLSCCLRFFSDGRPPKGKTRFRPACSALAGLDFHQLDSVERFHRLTSNPPSPSFAWRDENPILGA